MKKKISIIGIVLVLIVGIIFSIMSYAENQILYIGINKTHSNGVGYGIGDPSENNGGTTIWNLRNYNSESKTDESTEPKEIYCLKADYGESWVDSDVVIPYNLDYDFQSDRSELLDLLNTAGTAPNNVVAAILDADNGYYEELLWVLDNVFIPGKMSVTDFLENIGIVYDEEYSVYFYEPDEKYDYSDLVDSLSGYTFTMTETDIKAVQQAVIWYFMNAKLDNDETYDILNLENWLTITTDDGASYTNLASYNRYPSGEGAQRHDQAVILYNYLIESAMNNASKYTAENGYTIAKPVELNVSGLETDESGNYEVEMTRYVDYYITGPIKIDKNNDLDYNIDLKVTDEDGTEITDYTLTDSSATVLNTDINKLVGIEEGFYIAIPKNVAKQINIDLTIKYNTIQKTLWLYDEDNETPITLNAEQPAVELTLVPYEEILTLTAEVEEFDLALRKYITAINGTNVTDARIPNIDEGSLQTGTTATYKHRKEPVLVEKGDVVTYQITIYNEGQKAGYATEIKDQLPTGLKYSGGETVTSNKNTYNVEFDETTNMITFLATTNTALNKYETGTLDSETLEFICEVTATPDTANDKILTNVAWISGAYDSKAGVEIINVGDDRDSTPQTTPTVDKDSMENYKGNSSNKTDLTDSGYHYQGEQDDDDFEKLVIEPQTSITVTKTWSDNNDQDGIRPDSVNVTLYAEVDSNKDEKETQTLNSSNSWTYTFSNLPLKQDGVAITYSVVESSAGTGYSTLTSGDAEQGFTITNTHTPEVIEIPVEKVWEDGGNQDGIRPTEITINLLVGGVAVEGQTLILNEANDWKSTFTDLPKYENGNEITYTVEEEGIPEDNSYTSGITGDMTTGFTITNTHVPATTNVPVKKVWEDHNDQDGIRPTEITVKLLADGSETGQALTLNEGNSWNGEFSNLAKYAAGKEIEYTVVEDSVPEGYIAEITGDATNGYIITNIHKIFDLALRKNIIAVNGTNVTNTRVPNVDQSALENLTDTTAEYKHRKEPVQVEYGNIVTYQITIYNEGEKSGYASQIIDQLPTGLIYNPSSTITSKDANGNDKNTYTVTYEASTNKIAFDIVNTEENPAQDIEAYSTEDLDKEILEFECKVVEEADTVNQKVLTNVAWISGAFDTEENKVAVDRDSQPETIPSVNKDSMEDYKGNTTNKDDLTDSEYYYQGEQDDDDFEKLIIEPESVDISVEKVWEDNNNQDGKRIEKITVKLLADEVDTGTTAELNASNEWTYTFEKLAKKSSGEEIQYTVEETEVPDGYEVNITGSMAQGYRITNTHVPETRNISIKKIWEDSDNQDGIRPQSITITLYANDQEVKGKSITLEGQGNEWTYTFTDLPKYENGNEITYTVKEEGLPEDNTYTSAITGDMETGYIITNTHIPSKLNISVQKVWQDNNNNEGTRPTDITVNLVANGTTVNEKILTLNEGNSWKGEFTDLPEYEAGEKIEYAVSEPNVPNGYTVNMSGNMADGFIITNTHKIFDLALRKNIKAVNETNVTNTRVPNISETTLENGTTATYNHRKEPVQVEYGNTVTYQITIYNEGEKTGYASQIIDQLPVGLKYADAETITSNKNTYNVTYDEESNKIIFDITGTPNDLAVYETGKLDSETLEFECEVIAESDTTNRKILTNVAWISGAFDTEENKDAIDRDSQPGEAPEVDKENINDYTGNSSNKTELDDADYHYQGEQDDDDFEKLVIEPESVDISVEKVWEDNNNQDGKRIEKITVRLLADGVDANKTIELNKDNSWNAKFEKLTKKSNGTEIQYTVEEAEVLDGYEVDITGSMTDGYTITNTHIPETRNISVKKVWEDSDDQDGKRPQSITLTLYANNQEVEGQAITLQGEGNEWTYIFENLPKYENGQEIQYTVVETGIPQGYTSSGAEGDMANGFTITNSYTPETRNIVVQKVWVDNENQDGLRPDSITVTLFADGEAVEGHQNITLSGEGWTHTFENLPKYKDKQEIQYTVQENGVPEGYTSLTSGNMTNGYTITNTYTPGMTSVKVTKVWEDNNNQDGIRAQSVTVNLLSNGTDVVGTIVLSDDNEWTHTFTDLPEKANGEDIAYTVEEITQIDGYTTTITNNNVTSEAGEIQLASAPEYTITNTHETEEISITVNKVWDDENNYAQIRPTSVVVNIKNGETVVDTVTLSNENNWTHTFENLPAKENGENINYTIEEIEPEGYTADIIDNGDNSYTITNTHVPEKSFDLALRKYITKINNNELSVLGLQTREPNISEDTLKTGTTANYRHRKNPVEVEEGDIVTYQITIYNEGEKSGYASQIVDQLPTGLIYNPSNTITSKDANGNEKNTYTVTYEASTNKVTFDIVNTEENPAQDLAAYTTNNLDSETIEIKCKVIYRAVAGEKNILTNVAWINEAYDTVDNKQITEIGDDRDSEPGTKPNVNKDNMEDYKGNDSNKDVLTDDTYYYKGQQDDDDFEKLYVKTFDLSLRKFITSVNGNKTSREPVVDVTPLVNGTDSTAIYKHSKTPVSLKIGDTVIYTIRVYNEGEIAGYANEVKDYLPPYLEYLENSTINSKYGWIISEDGRVVTTAYLSDKEITEFNGTQLDYEDIQIECKISNNAIPDEKITNIAEISEYKYGGTVVPEDIDSESDNIDENLPSDEELPKYKEEQENDEYVPGNEDDDDFEKVYVKEFDLALRKFITQIQEEQITTRVPEVINENGKLSYNHTKDPITLHVGEIVIYTLRIYNEGEINGYASEITDDIPEYLEYLPKDNTNVEYMWKMYDENGKVTENVEEAVKVKTTYLSKENGEDNLIPAFDGSILSHRDIKIAFKVKDPNSNTQIITNYAQISDDTDEDGNQIKDKDSETDKWNEGEDDQDIENVKVEYFDLSILKFVSKVIVIEDGSEKITQTGYNGHENPEPVVKVELHKKKLDKVSVKFGYGITITNEGDVPGYATEITDYVPEGLRFEASDNPLWTDEGNNVISTKQLENTLLQPGESVTTEVILTWINGSENLALKTNIVEISDDNNQYDVPDRDSTPDNKVDGEDDIDLAEVILVISTGNAKTYFTLTLGLLGVVLVGVVLIKKYVLY